MARTNLIGKTSTKVTENDGIVSVVYHRTEVVRIVSGIVYLCTGGWFTATTKLRMNQAAEQFGLGFRVHQDKGSWFVRVLGEDRQWANALVVPFTSNSLTIYPIKAGLATDNIW